jgi:murein L,D-transpeptidase YafK
MDRFNPWSNFYLSLGINYPNNADRIKGDSKNLGGDIFIHGDCVTVGCIPLTDDKIMELYVYAVEAKNNGQDKIPVHIFPTRLSKENFDRLITEHKDDVELINFWANLKIGYDYFDMHKIPAKITISAKGNYEFE